MLFFAWEILSSEMWLNSNSVITIGSSALGQTADWFAVSSCTSKLLGTLSIDDEEDDDDE